MRSSVLVSLFTLLTLAVAGLDPVLACEKHLNGHQNSAETQTEARGQ